jgi:glycosyltransferase involved in cell wall biosynthesis
MLEQKNKYNILIVSPEYPPYNTGGGGIAYQSIAETLTSKGHNITVLSGDHIKEHNRPYSEKINDVEVTRLPLTDYKLEILKAKTPPNKYSKKQIKSILKDQDFDFAIIFGAFEYISVYMSKLLKEKNIPYVLQAHGYPDLSNYNLIISLIFKLYEKFFLLKMFKNAKFLYSVSPDQNLPLETKYLPNGIDVEKFGKIKKTFDIREKHNIPKDNFIIFSIGRLHEHKGFQYVIEAIKELKNITYIIAGNDDGYLKNLKQLSKDMDNVIFTGFLNDDEKKNYFDQADIHILPSLQEFFGLVVLEAMVFGTPTIGSRIGGMQKTLKNGENGFLVKPKDIMGIKESVQKIKDDPLLLSEMSKRCEELVIQYSWESVADKILSDIEKLNET